MPATPTIVGALGGFRLFSWVFTVPLLTQAVTRGVGTGSQMFMRMLGQSVGAAVFGAILNFGVDRRLPGIGDMVNRMLDPATRHSLEADTLSRLADAVGPASHEAFVVAPVVAAATLAATLALPPRLNPASPGSAGSGLSRCPPTL